MYGLGQDGSSDDDTEGWRLTPSPGVNRAFWTPPARRYMETPLADSHLPSNALGGQLGGQANSASTATPGQANQMSKLHHCKPHAELCEITRCIVAGVPLRATVCPADTPTMPIADHLAVPAASVLEPPTAGAVGVPMPQPVIAAVLASDPLIARPLHEEMSTPAPLPESRAMAEPPIWQGKVVDVRAEPPSHKPEPQTLEAVLLGDPGPQFSVAKTVPLPLVETGSLGLSGGIVSAGVMGNLFWPKREPPTAASVETPMAELVLAAALASDPLIAEPPPIPLGPPPFPLGPPPFPLWPPPFPLAPLPESPAMAEPGPQPQTVDTPVPQPPHEGGITAVHVEPASEPAHKPEPGHALEHPSRAAPGPPPPFPGEPVPGLPAMAVPVPLVAAAEPGLSGAALTTKQARGAKRLLGKQAVISGVSMKRPAGAPPATPSTASEAAPRALDALPLPPPPLANARGNGDTFQGRRRPKDPKKAAKFDEQRRLYWENKQKRKIEHRELQKKDTDLLLLRGMLPSVFLFNAYGQTWLVMCGVVCVCVCWFGAVCKFDQVWCVLAHFCLVLADNGGLPGQQWSQKEEG